MVGTASDIAGTLSSRPDSGEQENRLQTVWACPLFREPEGKNGNEGKEDCRGCAYIFSRCKTLWERRLAICRKGGAQVPFWSLVIGRGTRVARGERPTGEGARVCVRWN